MELQSDVRHCRWKMGIMKKNRNYGNWRLLGVFRRHRAKQFAQRSAQGFKQSVSGKLLQQVL
jgi:hypothetical protein